MSNLQQKGSFENKTHTFHLQNASELRSNTQLKAPNSSPKLL